MYLQRMNARMGRGFARVMDGLDGGLSVRCIGRCERKPVIGWTRPSRGVNAPRWQSKQPTTARASP
ncbi:hypothetical protein FQ187_06115 [Pseudomonas sp. ANT_J28]|nr:hypothetical protein FQ187_06115 [Pseudomonas sp. ANT_J28]